MMHRTSLSGGGDKPSRMATAVVVALWAAPVLLAQVREHVVPVKDIDQWHVEVFSGAYNPGGLLQGPLLQAGHDRRGPMVFLPGGEACTASEGVVFIFTREGTLRYLAGDPDQPGYREGPADEALLGRELSIASDSRGGLLIADRSNRCLRRATRKEGRWFIETVAGHPDNPKDRKLLRIVRDESPMGKGTRKEYFAADGTGRKATFNYLHSNVIADARGNAYLIDADFLRRISPEGEVKTLNPAGGTGPPANPEGEPVRSARFRLIMAGSICFDHQGNIYVADRWNHCVRKIDLKKQVVSVAIGPGGGYVDGPAGKAGFHDSPGHIAYDPYRKRLYVTGVDDWGLRVFEDGAMKTIAGGKRTNRATDGPAREAGMQWAGVRAVDPRSPHDIYFWSGGTDWRGRIGRLYRVAPDKKEQP
jgi:NHL repeat